MYVLHIIVITEAANTLMNRSPRETKEGICLSIAKLIQLLIVVASIAWFICGKWAVAITLLVLIIKKHFYGQRHAGNKTYTTLYLGIHSARKYAIIMDWQKSTYYNPTYLTLCHTIDLVFLTIPFVILPMNAPHWGLKLRQAEREFPRCIWYPGLTAPSLYWGEGWWLPLPNTFLSSGDQDMGATNFPSHLESEHLDYWYTFIIETLFSNC